MIRFAHQDDLPFLRWMLYEAAYPEVLGERPPFEKGLADPQVARYLDGWVRKGDAGLIFTSEAGGPLGAAWYRLFTADEPGWGFVNEQTPELAIAVVYEARGKGVGTHLLQALMTLAGKQGHRQLSLSADPPNTAALRLYRKLGFREVGNDGETITMVADLTSAPQANPAG